MKKVVAGALFFLFFIFFLIYTIIPDKKVKKEEITSAMGTLGNFAENHSKTEENIKKFNDIFNDGASNTNK